MEVFGFVGFTFGMGALVMVLTTQTQVKKLLVDVEALKVEVKRLKR